MAIFLYDKRQELSAEARARLQTISEASELGAGFQIAMRDLEIRGAGDVLGARQSGHIAAVGFDLYCRLLAHAIEEQRDRIARGEESGRGQAPERQPDGDLLNRPTIELPIPAQIPEGYVDDSALRLRLYRRLADVTTTERVEEMAKEFEDRFGSPPEPMRNLFFLLRLKLAAHAAQAAAVAMDEDRVVVRFKRRDDERSALLSRRFGAQVRVAPDRMWLAGPETDRHWRIHLLEVLQAIIKETDRRAPALSAS